MRKICNLQKKKSDLQEAGNSKKRIHLYTTLIKKYKSWLDKANETIKSKLQQIFKAKYAHATAHIQKGKLAYKKKLIGLINKSNKVKKHMEHKLKTVQANVKNFDKLLPKITAYKKRIHANFHKASELYRNNKAKQLQKWFYMMMKKYGLKAHMPSTPAKGHKHGFHLKIHGKKHHKLPKKKAPKAHKKKAHKKGLGGAKKALKKTNAKLAALRKKGHNDLHIKKAKKPTKKAPKKAAKKPAPKKRLRQNDLRELDALNNLLTSHPKRSLKRHPTRKLKKISKKRALKSKRRAASKFNAKKVLRYLLEK